MHLFVIESYFVFCFFFSSRRRHTRCGRDWSSDVCSSDLSSPSADRRVPSARSDATPATSWREAARLIRGSSAVSRRSEERRVGKEWRAWGSPGDVKKKKKYIRNEV